MADYSYIGSGKVYLREIGGSAGLIEVGNCSAVNFSITEETVELKDYTQPGGGTYNEVRRISAVESQITMHDLSGPNLARALYGANTVVSTTPVVDEPHTVAATGSFIPTDTLPSAIGAVKVGAATMVENTDYEVRPGGIYIIPGGGITASNVVLISYTRAAADRVQALVNSGKEYEMVFDGLNEARSGKRTRVSAYRVKIGAAQNLGFVGDEYAALEVTGKVLKDTSKIGAGVSQYFKVEIQA
jgi:hypothetical protein